MKWNVVGWRVRSWTDPDKMGVVVEFNPQEQFIRVRWDLLGNVTDHVGGNEEIILVPPPEIQKAMQDAFDAMQKAIAGTEMIQARPWLN